MKKFIAPLWVVVVLSCTEAPAQTDKFNEHIHKEFSLQKGANASTLAIYNIDGLIKVEGYSGDKVIIDVDKTISAKTAGALEKGKQEFKFEIDQDADTIMAYIAQPYDSRPHQRWQENNHHRRIEYRYRLDFTVKVPYNLNVSVSTVNDGDITVSDISGKLNVHNVNGAITLKNVKNDTKARTVNGNVNASYTALPPNQSDFYTLNGNLNINYPSNLSADCEFKSFQGEFYTDFQNVETLPTRVIKQQEKNEHKTTYKLSTETAIRIGDGGRVFRFETFNGNIYLKKL
ncbi:MAG: hypothetical protein U0Y10_08295 [Spirosomataceae bacterium]